MCVTVCVTSVKQHTTRCHKTLRHPSKNDMGSCGARPHPWKGFPVCNFCRHGEPEKRWCLARTARILIGVVCVDCGGCVLVLALARTKLMWGGRGAASLLHPCHTDNPLRVGISPT